MINRLWGWSEQTHDDFAAEHTAEFQHEKTKLSKEFSLLREEVELPDPKEFAEKTKNAIKQK